MEELLIYPTQKEIPPLIHQQIMDFLRVVWDDGFQGENRLRNWISHDYFHPVSFVLVENGQLISHIEVVWKMLEHAGKTYKTYGLSGVLTYPQFRKKGYGLKLLNATKEYIEKQDADIVMFHSDLIGFYEKGGFERMNKVVTLKGDPDKPETDDGCAFMLFLSEKGENGRNDFETKPVFFGEETW